MTAGDETYNHDMASFPSRIICLTLANACLHGAQPEVAWNSSQGYHFLPIQVSAFEGEAFTSVDPKTSGIRFQNLLASERGLSNQVLLNGSGVAAGDVNQDGLCDLYFCALDGPNALYINKGDWNFVRKDLNGGVACEDQSSTGAALVDVNGDGSLDLLISGHRRGVRLFLNDGLGQFQEATDKWQLGGQHGSASMAIADVDGNGWLDLYVVNYRNDTIRDMPNGQFDVRLVDGKYTLVSFNGQAADSPGIKGRFSFDRANGILENGEPDQLFLNQGNGNFEPVAWDDGHFLEADGSLSKIPYDWGLSAMFYDINGDHAPDLYVCNDFQSPDRIWINSGNGSFKAADPNIFRQTSLFSMGLDFADIDRDALPDLFVADMLSRSHQRRMVQVMDGVAFAQFRDARAGRPQSPRNTLFLQRSDKTFREQARYSGVEASEWSWCPIFLDVDLDGFEDLLVSTGHWRDSQNADVARRLDGQLKETTLTHPQQLELRAQFPVLEVPNMAFKNRGDGTFEELGASWGFDSHRVSHGMALADLDNDGDMDVVVNCLNADALLYRNEAQGARVSVQVRDSGHNTHGIGALVSVEAPGLPRQLQRIVAGGRYLSSDHLQRAFAVKKTGDHVNIMVEWPDGTQRLLKEVPSNRGYRVQKQQELGALVSAGQKQKLDDPVPFFKEVSERLNHLHANTSLDDFMQQALKPRKEKGHGPGMAWFDFNRDGWDDLFIGGGQGSRLGVYRNDGSGGFIRQRARAFEKALEQAQTSILAWEGGQGQLHLLMGQSRLRENQPESAAFNQFSMLDGSTLRVAGDGLSSSGPMIMADLDGDDDLDLFLGGRMKAGHYPAPSSGLLYRNKNGHLEKDPEGSRLFEDVGMVSSALFSDMVGSHLPDLILACEWGSIRMFENLDGQFREWNPAIKSDSARGGPMTVEFLNDMTGWWTSLVSMDANGDGRMDLVAGNWGRNHEYGHASFQPLQLYYGGPRGPGGIPMIESHRDPVTNRQVPTRDWGTLSQVLPWIRSAYTSFETFSQAGTSDVIKVMPGTYQSLEACFFDSVLFLNHGDFFKLHPLPSIMQQSPLFGLGVGDFNGDGNEDLVASQNFFDVNPLDSRQDAGNGMLLTGNGEGKFMPVDSGTSGILLQGEGRGLAVADFNKDGRPDFAASAFRGRTQLYENVAGKPGIGVRLRGRGGNPHAIGARVRLIYENGRRGPAREWHLGEGYWSQNASRQILGRQEFMIGLEVRWPDGVIQEVFSDESKREWLIQKDPDLNTER
jgi:enediyne biosynthesis protein E4